MLHSVEPVSPCALFDIYSEDGAEEKALPKSDVAVQALHLHARDVLVKRVSRAAVLAKAG